MIKTSSAKNAFYRKHDDALDCGEVFVVDEHVFENRWLEHLFARICHGPLSTMFSKQNQKIYENKEIIVEWTRLPLW